jgi:phosphatidylglycerophosphatase A
MPSAIACMQNSALKAAATFFGIGFLPFFPGTWGSAAGGAVFLILPETGPWRFAVCSGIILCGFIVSGKAEQVFARKDPKYVVIDEVAGMMISLLWLPLYNIKVLLIAFLLFRALDTIKPFPANWIQDRHGALGIMGDDIAAAVYANLILQAVLRLVS